MGKQPLEPFQQCELCVWMSAKQSRCMTQTLIFLSVIISLCIYLYIECEGDSATRPTWFGSVEAKQMETM